MSRRALLSRSLALGGAALAVGPAVARAQPAARPTTQPAQPPGSGTRLVLLGTQGGPSETPGRSQPAQAIQVDGVPYLVDYGDGVARQLVAAGVALGRLRYLFLTHHHSDHSGGYVPLLLRAWAVGLRRVESFGPPTLAAMTEAIPQAYAADITARTEAQGADSLAPFASFVGVHEFDGLGLVHEDERVRVTATTVVHPPVEPSFAYRFDTAERSIVISGDTAFSENLIALADGADVLVHEVYHTTALPEILNSPRGPAHGQNMLEHFIIAHTTAEDVGRVATAAGVTTVVLSHFARAKGSATRCGGRRAAPPSPAR